jgi:membrane protein
VGGAARLHGVRRDLRHAVALAGRAAWEGIDGFYHRDDFTYAASVAYYSLLSLFPLFMLALTLLGYATGDAANRAAVFDFILRYFPTQFGFISSQLDQLRAETVTLGVVGTVALLWGALGVFGAVTTAVNYAWGAESQPSFWRQKLLSFLMLVVAGVLLLVALLLVSASQMVGATWFAAVLTGFPGLDVLRGLTVRYATTLLFVVVVGCVYWFVPNTRVRLRDVWIGAIVTGLLWKGALSGFSWFLRDMTRFTRVNGSIAVVVVFLVWVYLQAAILLYGAEFTAAYARLRSARDASRASGATRELSTALG